MPLAQRGQQSQNFGRSKGYFSTKVHATTDSLGCPTRFILTGGNESDYTQAMHLIEDQQADFVIADKGYDSQTIVDASNRRAPNLLSPPALIERHRAIMIAISTKKETRLNACSIKSSNLDESQHDMINWPSLTCRSCMWRP